jgi:hypothetical protein
MKAIHFLLTLFVFGPAAAAFAAEGQAAAPAAKPAETLDGAIVHAMQLLETLKYKEFLETYMPPDVLKKTVEKFGMEKFTKDFSEKNGPRMLGVLNAVKGTKPTMEDDGKTAKFVLPGDAIQQKQSITFSQIHQRWYIQRWILID